MKISAEQVKALRQMTGAGVLNCQKALEEAQGDLDAAAKILREKGLRPRGALDARPATEWSTCTAMARDGWGS